QVTSERIVERHVGRGKLVKRSQFNYNDDSVASKGPRWLFGLHAGEREILGSDAALLSELAGMGERRDIISFAAGTPAPDLLPAEMLSTIIADHLLSSRQHALGYSPVEGLQSLRRNIAAYMRERGVDRKSVV